MGKQRNIRKRRAVDDDDEISQGEGDEDTQKPLTAEEIRFLQKQRQRKTGVGAETLAGAGSKASLPIMPTAEAGKIDDGMALHAAFNKERIQLAEADDPEMKRYVEEQLAKRLGKDLAESHKDDATGSGKGSKRPKTVEELALEAAVPKQKDLYSDPGAAFVAGVAEVPLGVEHKLKNIEATEAAKAALLARGGNAARAKYGGSRFLEGEEEGDVGGGYYYGNDNGGGGNGNGNGAFRRGQFPVRFGKMSEKEQGVLADVAAKKQVQKARAADRKREQQTEFKGFF
ncbi:putative Protein COP1 SUPPRESSOR 2 [Nannochloris sp. 'desiccata']|nr:hypothetical protein KSW81_005695 [Chlorella desiccata (nom. nud.)]KAH7623400.1 putative Protein COP1 SUPPRESSOR 2 [Chlorella desiccata (nom. nud.)]